MTYIYLATWLLTQRPWGREEKLSSKIQIVGQKYRDKTALAAKRDSAAIVWVFKAGAFLNWAMETHILGAGLFLTQLNLS